MEILKHTIRMGRMRMTYEYRIICDATIAHWKPDYRPTKLWNDTDNFVPWDELKRGFTMVKQLFNIHKDLQEIYWWIPPNFFCKFGINPMIWTLTSAKCWSVPQMPQHVTAEERGRMRTSYSWISFNHTFDKDLIIINLRNWNGDNVQILRLGAS